MSIEATFVLPDGAPRRPVGELVDRLAGAGFSPREEPDEYGHWIVFDDLESALNVSVVEGEAVFATLEISPSDSTEAIDGIGRVFTAAGWDTDPAEQA